MLRSPGSSPARASSVSTRTTTSSIWESAPRLDRASRWSGTAGRVARLSRHGESEANVAGRWHGRADGPLSEHGRAQAVALGERYLDVTRVFASPLARARETAEAFAASHHIEVGIRDDLVEIDLGVWENLTVAEISERHPDEGAAVFEHGHDLPRGGTGETSAGAGARLGAAIDDGAARPPRGRGAVGGRGG